MGARNHAIDFFDRQFERQAAAGDYALNSFERLALPHARGDVLDFGCGLGNLAIEAARQGARVVAVDASPAAINDLTRRASAEALPVHTVLADAARYQPGRRFDTVVCIGLLMFLDCGTAGTVLERLAEAVLPGGVLVVNVLVRGTTYMEMFDPAAHCLFEPGAIDARFAGWPLLAAEDAQFDAPGGTRKVFRTLVVRRPA